MTTSTTRNGSSCISNTAGLECPELDSPSPGAKWSALRRSLRPSTWFYGEPAPQGSKVQTKWGGLISDAKLQPWRASINTVAQSTRTDAGPVSLDVAFVLPRAKDITERVEMRTN